MASSTVTSCLALICLLVAVVPNLGWACINIEGDLSCVDFNCSLSWEPAAEAAALDENAVYTVYYAKRYTIHDVVQVWEAIEACTNLTDTQCKVGALFQTNDDFRGNKRFRIDYVLGPRSKTTTCTGKKFQSDPLKSVILSAPSVNHVEINANEMSFRLTYPVEHGYPDLDLRQLRQFVNHKYHVIITETRTNVSIQDYEITEELASRQRIPNVKPATSYTIRVKSAVFPPEIWSLDTTALVLKTSEKAPSKGPQEFRIVNTSFSCEHPGLRDALLHWKAPEEMHWNGDLNLYEVRVLTLPSREVTSRIRVEAPSTVVFLHGLSRWEDYELQVFANNSAGGCQNAIPLHLEKHVVDARGSQPRNIKIESYQHDVTLIEWQPPLHYPECIVGYRVTWTDADAVEHRMIVYDVTSVEIKGHHVMWVRVTPILSFQQNSPDGIATIYGLQPDEVPGFNPWLLLLTGMVILLIICFVVIVAKRQYIKTQWIKPHFRDNFPLDDNKVLRPLFDRHVSYEPCQRQEREIFDAPSPGIYPPEGSSLPPWIHDVSQLNSRYGELHGRPRDYDLSAMASLLTAGGMKAVSECDEVQHTEAMRRVNVEGDSSMGGSGMDMSGSGGKTDSAIDTLSDTDDADEQGDLPATHNVVPDSMDGYILHSGLRDHLRANEHIGDYTVTDVAALCTTTDNDQAVSSSQESGIGLADELSRNPVVNTPLSGQPRNDVIDASPYVLHSQLPPFSNTSSLVPDVSGSSISDYSKQALSSDECVENSHSQAQTQSNVVIGASKKTNHTDQKEIQRLEQASVPHRALIT